VNDATRDALIRRSADGTWQLLHQQREARVQLDRMEDLATGASLRALLIYGLTGLLSTLLGTLLGHMVWRAIQ
jgi:hypothetical protein